jgi:hypothetical protein
MSSDVESIGRGDHVAKIWVWLKSPSDTLSESNFTIAGVIDWEFAYVAPAEFTSTVPW